MATVRAKKKTIIKGQKKVAGKKVAKKASKKKTVKKATAKKTMPRANDSTAPSLKKKATSIVSIIHEMRVDVQEIKANVLALAQMLFSMKPIEQQVTAEDISLTEPIPPGRVDLPLMGRTEVVSPMIIRESPNMTPIQNNPAPVQQELFGTSAQPIDSGLSREEVGQALQQVMGIAGQEQVKKILTSYNVVRVSEIKDVDFDSIYTLCKSITDGAQTPQPSNTVATSPQNAANPATSIF